MIDHCDSPNSIVKVLHTIVFFTITIVNIKVYYQFTKEYLSIQCNTTVINHSNYSVLQYILWYTTVVFMWTSTKQIAFIFW